MNRSSTPTARGHDRQPMPRRSILCAVPRSPALLLMAGLLGFGPVAATAEEAVPPSAQDGPAAEPVGVPAAPDDAAAEAGILAAIQAGTVLKDMTIAQVLQARGEPLRKEVIPPDAELWHYAEGEVAFAGGKVSYVSAFQTISRQLPSVESPGDQERMLFDSDYERIEFKNAKDRQLLINTSSCVTLVSGELTLNQCQEDNGPTATLKIDLRNKSEPIVFERFLFIHPEYSRSYQGGNIFYTGGLGIKTAGGIDLFNVAYYNYEYECKCNFIWVNDKVNRTDPIWNEWFKEQIIYYPVDGKVVYKTNGNERLVVNARALDSDSLIMNIHTYGWWTGHHMKMKNFRIYQ